MRLGLVLVATAQELVVPVAAAHARAPAWPAAKAERLVERDAVVLMPVEQRSALRAEPLSATRTERERKQSTWRGRSASCAHREVSRA